MNQYVIIRDNCESYVAWAETKEEAIQKCKDDGHSDIWKVLLKAHSSEKQEDRGY